MTRLSSQLRFLVAIRQPLAIVAVLMAMNMNRTDHVQTARTAEAEATGCRSDDRLHAGRDRTLAFHAGHRHLAGPGLPPVVRVELVQHRRDFLLPWTPGSATTCSISPAPAASPLRDTAPHTPGGLDAPVVRQRSEDHEHSETTSSPGLRVDRSSFSPMTESSSSRSAAFCSFSPEPAASQKT